MKFTSFNATWATLILVVYVVIAAYAAVAVYRDAKKRDDLFLDLHPVWWAAMTLIGAITGVVGYWALHYSSLRESNKESESAEH